MTTPESPLMPIGRFAQAARLSLKALRIYDRMGLLRPARVDAASGYRYYRPEQVREARLISLLRSLDMPLALIRAVVEARPDQSLEEVEAYWRSVEAGVERRRRIVRYLRSYMAREGGNAVTTVQTRDIPGRQCLSVLGQVFVADLPCFIRDAFHALHARIAEEGGRADGRVTVIYHGEVNEDSDGPVEVCVPVERGSVRPTSEFRLTEEPPMRAAYTTITLRESEFPTILNAYDAVLSWIRENGHEPAAPPREVYLAEPDCVGPDDLNCDVEWPYLEQARDA